MTDLKPRSDCLRQKANNVLEGVEAYLESCHKSKTERFSKKQSTKNI